MAPTCSNCGASDFVWANDLKTGSMGRGELSLRRGGELSIGTRICRQCGHADLFVKDPAVLRQPHTWRPGEFTPIPAHPAPSSTPSRPQAPSPTTPEPPLTPPASPPPPPPAPVAPPPPPAMEPPPAPPAPATAPAEPPAGEVPVPAEESPTSAPTDSPSPKRSNRRRNSKTKGDGSNSS